MHRIEQLQKAIDAITLLAIEDKGKYLIQELIVKQINEWKEEMLQEVII